MAGALILQLRDTMSLISADSGSVRVRARPFFDLKEDTLWPFLAILCRGGLDVIRKEAWPFYRTSFSVRLCWEPEEPKGPEVSASPV